MALVGGYSNGNSQYNMRDKHYKNKTIRLSDEDWIKVKEARQASGKSWNLFLKDYLKLLKKKPANSGK
jgi:hypothetical protein